MILRANAARAEPENRKGCLINLNNTTATRLSRSRRAHALPVECKV